MFYALGWSVVFILLALWSLAAWAFHAIATWTVANSGVLAGSGAIEGLRLPAWLAPWIPPEFALAFTSMMAAVSPAIEAVVNQMPALAGGLSVAIWVIWGVGSALLVILGLVFSGLMAAMRRRGTMFAAPAMGPAGAN